MLCKLISFILCLKLLAELACFICICILCDLSSKNPFKNHKIGNLTIYFTDAENNITSNINKLGYIDMKYKTGIKRRMLKNTNIYSGFNIKNKRFFRKLISKSFCAEIRSYFIEFKGEKLSNIFELNYEKILHMSIAILVVSCVLIFFFIIFVFGQSSLGKCWRYFKIIFFLTVTLLYIGKFILSIILFYFIEKGDIEKYDDF